nr:MucBP domain-containing protein [Clostridia bacterium]
EYYYDEVKDNDSTETIEATYLDEITTYTDKVKTGYKFDKVEGLPLTINTNENENIIKVYYKKVDAVVIENYINVLNNVLIDSETIETTGEEEYELGAKEIEGFFVATNREYYKMRVKMNPNFLAENNVETLDEYFRINGINPDEEYLPEIQEATEPNEVPEVDYYYMPKAKLKIRYVDILTGEEIVEVVDNEEISSTVELEGRPDDEYTADSKIFKQYMQISNKTYYRIYFASHQEELEEENVTTVDEYLAKKNIDPKALYIPENAEGFYTIVEDENGNLHEEKVVTFYYGAIREVKVKYIDQKTGEEIGEEVIKVGPDGDEFSIVEDKKEIEGYTLIEEPEDTDGVYTETNSIRKYSYAKNTKVIVKYVDESTGKVIEEDEISGYEGKQYKTTQKSIDGYAFVRDSQNTKGSMARYETEVVYYYRKADQQVTPEPEKPTEEPNANQKTTQENTTIVNNYYYNTTNNYTTTQTQSQTPQSTTTEKANTQVMVSDATSNKTETSSNATSKEKTPSSGDMIPVVTIGTIIVTIFNNIILSVIARFRRKNKK